MDSRRSRDAAVVLRVLAQGRVVSTHPVTEADLRIGRGRENEIVLEGQAVSRLHAKVYARHGRYWVEDLDSANGTHLNGSRVDRSSISVGDRLEVGPFVLELAHAGDPVREADASDRPEPVDAAPSQQELAILLSLLESYDVELTQEDSLRRILVSLLKALDGERAHLYRYDSRRATATLVLSHLIEGADAKLPVSETLVLKVARERKPCLMKDLIAAEATEGPSIVRLAEGHVQSVVLSPLTKGRRLVGVLYLDSRSSRRSFTTQDLDLLSRASGFLAGLVEGIEAHDKLTKENRKLRAILGDEPGHQVPLEKLHAPTSPFAQVMVLIRKAASRDVTVLLNGETGTGKEEAARAIHRQSNRCDGPFIAINCGAIPETLVESELFGYCKGAFSGAQDDRPGLIELASSGTLFLDEVGELPLPTQVKLLRVLEERQVQRLGTGEITPVDFRLIAATHRDLAARVGEGTFRQDLLYRLNVFPIVLPPLRDRKDDLELIVGFLVDTLTARAQGRVTSVAPQALAMLAGYRWPGNIRELRNVLERALVIEESEVLTPGSLPPELAAPPGERAKTLEAAPGPLVRPYAEELREFERDYVKRLRREVGSNISAMARVSGISRFTLYRKLGEIGLDPGLDAGDGEPPAGGRGRPA